MGCSTNTTLHLPAIAYEAGARFDLDEVNRITASVPHLCSLAPAGAHFMEDLYQAGGVQALMKQLLDAGKLDGSARSVTGGSVADAVAGARVINSRGYPAHGRSLRSHRRPRGPFRQPGA